MVFILLKGSRPFEIEKKIRFVITHTASLIEWTDIFRGKKTTTLKNLEEKTSYQRYICGISRLICGLKNPSVLHCVKKQIRWFHLLGCNFHLSGMTALLGMSDLIFNWNWLAPNGINMGLFKSHYSVPFGSVTQNEPEQKTDL